MAMARAVKATASAAEAICASFELSSGMGADRVSHFPEEFVSRLTFISQSGLNIP